MTQTYSRTLRDSLAQAPVVRFGDYDYFVHPLTDGTSCVEPNLLEEAAREIASRMPPGATRILTAEAMGLPLAAALATQTRLPYMVARKRKYGLPDEIEVPYETGYAKGTLFLNGLKREDAVVIVDDVLSRGGTLRAMARAVELRGAKLLGTVVLVNKSADLDVIAQAVGAPVRAVFRVRIEAGKVVVED